MSFTLDVHIRCRLGPNLIQSAVSSSIQFPAPLVQPSHTEEKQEQQFSNSNITMASISPLQFSAPATTVRLGPQQYSPRSTCFRFRPEARRSLSRVVTVSAFGDVSSDSSLYLFAGAAAVALIGTAFPLLFSRRDLCPECDGAGFIRQAGAPLRVNAARKDQPQIVCPRCKGLGKLGQIDK